MLSSIAKIYGLPESECQLTPFGNGLISHTWLLECRGEKFILQRLNVAIFTRPDMIADNIHQLGKYLQQNFPDYFFVNPVSTTQNEELVHLPGDGYFRMFTFVKDSFTFDIATNVDIAYGAARQFGKFTNLLSGFDAEKLHITLPDFHNLRLRYQQFETALEKGNPQRIRDCAEGIDYLKSEKGIVDIFDTIQTNPDFKKRVTHHDTKISNVLFGKNGEDLCVIDLDTVMPGYFISDIGDMIRTYVSPVSEEEMDFSKINIREEYFQAIVEGYLSEMRNELSEAEKNYFVYAGKFMIYMQALRFLTDHLNNDIYYGKKYEGHNLLRGNNQIELLKQLIAKEGALQAGVKAYLQKPAVQA